MNGKLAWRAFLCTFSLGLTAASNSWLPGLFSVVISLLFLATAFYNALRGVTFAFVDAFEIIGRSEEKSEEEEDHEDEDDE